MLISRIKKALAAQRRSRTLRSIDFPVSRWLAPLALLALLILGSRVNAQDKKYKVYLDMSYSGNIWQAAAANGIKALASTPPYDKLIDFKTVISGTDVQKQISDLQSMVAAGANAIVLIRCRRRLLIGSSSKPAKKEWSFSPMTQRSRNRLPTMLSI